MPPKGFRKQSTTAAPQLLGAVLNIVRVLREADPQSMNLVIAENALEKELAVLVAPAALPLEPASV